jgi:hypothetical protein
VVFGLVALLADPVIRFVARSRKAHPKKTVCEEPDVTDAGSSGAFRTGNGGAACAMTLALAAPDGPGLAAATNLSCVASASS